MNNTYHKMNTKINPSNKLINRTIELTKPKKKLHIILRPVVCIFILCLVFAVAAPVMAANVPAVYEMIYMISPAAAQYFIPINESCIDKNIRMEVESVYIHENTAEIYITMQDLTGTLLDETTDLFDSYSINRPFNSAATCRYVDYDPDTHTARFLIQITEANDHPITGDKITFSVSELISKKTSIKDIKLPIDLSNISEAKAVKKQRHTGLSGKGDIDFVSIENLYLVPDDEVYEITDNMAVSAVGFIDGKLHVQLRMTGKLELDPHGSVYLMSKDGTIVECLYAQSYTDRKSNSDRVDYQEFVFEVPMGNIEDYEIYGSFYTAGINIDGDWRVTFALNNAKVSSK